MARGILAVNFFKIFIDKSNMLIEHASIELEKFSIK